MPRTSNRYRGPAELSKRRRTAAPPPSGRLGHIRRSLGAIRSRIGRLHARREIVIVGAFALALVIGLSSIGGAYLLYRSGHDWASVATVNGQSISREALRGRMAVLRLLAQERDSFIGEQLSANVIPSDAVATLQGEAAATTSLEAARQSLIDDELLRQLASRDGIATPASPDPWAEGTAYASSPVAHRVRYVRFGLPGSTAAGSGNSTPSPSLGASASPSSGPAAGSSPTATSIPTAGSSPSASASVSPTPSTGPADSSAPWPTAGQANVDATVARIRAEFAAATPVETIVAKLHDAGWQVLGEDVAVSVDGVPADSTLDLDPTIAADTTRGRAGDMVGPTTDAYGRISLGQVLASPDTTMTSRRLGVDVAKAKLDTAAFQSWADGQALRRAVTASLVASWSRSVSQAHFRELVVGAAPDSSATAGPWAELSVLMVDRLKGVNPSSITGAPSGLDLGADSLAGTLKSMTPTQRSALFGALVAAANRPPGPDTTERSGEVGFDTKDLMVPDLGKAALASGTRAGDIVGPISTPVGPELYLVEARYAGALDDRSKTALTQIRSNPAADPVTYASLYSPADAVLAVDAGWRAEPEFSSDEAVRAALFDTPTAALSDPFVLDGKLALAIVSERRTAAPDARTLDRLTLDGYNAWYASEYAKAKITRTDNPLPELVSPTPSASTAPELPSGPVLDTPNLPTVPGQPADTPVPTDAMGFPVLP